MTNRQIIICGRNKTQTPIVLIVHDVYKDICKRKGVFLWITTLTTLDFIYTQIKILFKGIEKS